MSLGSYTHSRSDKRTFHLFSGVSTPAESDDPSSPRKKPKAALSPRISNNKNTTVDEDEEEDDEDEGDDEDEQDDVDDATQMACRTHSSHNTNSNRAQGLNNFVLRDICRTPKTTRHLHAISFHLQHLLLVLFSTKTAGLHISHSLCSMHALHLALSSISYVLSAL
jgi:hypothetical protein